MQCVSTMSMGPRLPARPSSGARGPARPAIGAGGRRHAAPRAPRAVPPELLHLLLAGGAGAADASQGAAAAAAEHLLPALQHHLTLLYEPVAAPCSLMNCGDVIHRSTLDPVLRKEVGGPSWQVFALLAAAGLYLFAKPGVLPGFYDYYVAAALQAKKQRAVDKSDITLGRKLGSGAFGSVFKATLAPEEPGGETTAVIVKKAKEFGEAEAWMNERMSRASPGVMAEFVTAFEPGALGAGGRPASPPPAAPKPKMGLLGKKKVADPAAAADAGVWLVWKDEGDFTLWDLMQNKKDFPYNLEPVLLGRELRLPRGKRRRLVTVKLVMRQLLEALRDCHATGIVHRDFKPQNTIVSVAARRLKLIDWGAAADLRLGINYVPNEYLLDPRYAPPQQYIMSRQTPKPPPKPVAALLSPVLWAMEAPDRFDMYSAGITLLQLAFPSLRPDNGLIAFNRKLKDCQWDLNKWRESEALSKRGGQWPKELEEGFELLDADDGLGWDLACKLVTYNPRSRLTAAAALAHPWLASVPAAEPATGGSALLRAGAVAETLSSTVGTALTKTAETVGTAGGTITKSMEELLPAGLVEEAITASNRGALTEAYLLQEFGDPDDRAPAPPPREGRATIAWWNGRQQEIARKIEERRGGSARPSPGGTRQVVVKPSNGVKAAVNGAANGAKSPAPANGKAARAGKGRASAEASVEEPEGDAEAAAEEAAPAPAKADAASRVRDLLNAFGRR